MFVSKKFLILFIISLIGFTLGFRLSQSTLVAKPPELQPQLAVVQYEAAPISRRDEGNTS
jgi:hypothetical protein